MPHFVAGVAVYALLGPDRQHIEAGVQAALITVIGVAIAAAAAITAASFAARSAAVVADASRRAVLDGQLLDRKLALFADFLQAADVHVREVANQVAAVADRRPDDPVPGIGTTDAIELALGVLYAFTSQATADAALRVANEAIRLGRLFAFNAAAGTYPNGQRALGPDGLGAHAARQTLYQDARTDLIQCIRSELELPALVPAVLVAP